MPSSLPASNANEHICLNYRLVTHMSSLPQSLTGGAIKNGTRVPVNHDGEPIQAAGSTKKDTETGSRGYNRGDDTYAGA